MYSVNSVYKLGYRMGWGHRETVDFTGKHKGNHYYPLKKQKRKKKTTGW